MNAVMLRRLIGAGVILLMLFVGSLLLPAPGDPHHSLEPGLQRVEVAVDDTMPIDRPSASPAAAPSTASEPSLGPGLETPVPAADSNRGPRTQTGSGSLDAATSPDAALPATQDDDDAAAAPSADVETGEPPQAREALPAAVRIPPKPEIVAAKAAEAGPPPAPVTRPSLTPPAASAPKDGAKGAKPASTPAAATKPVTRVSVPAVAAKAPLPPRQLAKPAAKADAGPAPKAQPKPDPQAKAESGRWSLQAGSYAEIANARQVQSQLKAIGVSSSIGLVDAGGGARYRVRCGPYVSREAAEAARQRLAQSHIAASVVADGG